MDLPSVIVVSAFVTAAVGILLVYSGWQNKVKALLWWGAADLLIAAGTAAPIALQATGGGLFIEVVNAAVLIGWGMFWAGIRTFEGRPASLAWAVAGGVVWLAAAQVPSFQSDPTIAAALGLLISGSYVTASALVVIRGRAEPLISRNAAIFLLCAHAIVLIGRVPEAILSRWLPDHVIARSQLFAAFALENLLFTVSMAFVLLAMMKERLESLQRDKAHTDPLTGAPNRRAFFERGEVVLAETRMSGWGSAVILFDLDRFKGINDEHGHATGDRALVAFTTIALSELRPRDLFARIGGEEFVCLLPGLSIQEAIATADRIRAAMAACDVEAADGAFRATVSAGVQFSDSGRSTLDDMLRGADRALYEAKARGRDRVEVNKPDLVVRDGERVETWETQPGSIVRAFRNRA